MDALWAMRTSYRVTVHDLQQHKRRPIEANEPSPPIQAAKTTLRWMVDQDLRVEAFAPVVRVEIIRTVEHSFALSAYR